jgi:ubiquinone/menaquinone biosynthesis C-methylase UbiE
MSAAANVLKLAVQPAYELWALSYDSTPNAMLALEERYFAASTTDFFDKDVVELGCGTGRWLKRLEGVAKSLTGVDSSGAMLARARAKCEPSTLLIQADCIRTLLPDNCADCVLSSFVLSHLSGLTQFVREATRIVRPGGAILISDLHPDRALYGWRPTFHAPEGLVEVEAHTYTLRELVDVMLDAGYALRRLEEPCFGDEDAAIFERAGKLDELRRIAYLPAMYRARFVMAKKLVLGS